MNRMRAGVVPIASIPQRQGRRRGVVYERRPKAARSRSKRSRGQQRRSGNVEELAGLEAQVQAAEHACPFGAK